MLLRSGLLPCAVCCLALVACSDDVPAPAPGEDPSSGGTVVGAEAVVAPPTLDSVPLRWPEEDLQYELHGRLRGEPFWLRLEARDRSQPPTVHLRRILLQYSPPEATVPGAAVLADCPQLVVTSQLFIAAWGEQTGTLRSAAHYDPAITGYRVAREQVQKLGTEQVGMVEELQRPGPPAWSADLWPLQLALVWQAGSGHDGLPVLDFFADGRRRELRWEADRVRLGEAAFRVVADPEGRLAKLLDDAGGEVLVVAERQPPLDRAAVAERAARIEAQGHP